MFLFGARGFWDFGRRRRHETRLQPPGRDVIAHRQIERPDRFADPLAGLLDLVPTAQLLFEVSRAESDFAAIGDARREDAR